jgi:hypothetical protein
MKALHTVGATPEIQWPFSAPDILQVPDDKAMSFAASFKLSSYARLNGAGDFMRCLASGHPFVRGFLVPKSLDGKEIDKTGIMPTPNFATDPIVGGHDVLVVGYDTTFKQAPFFKDSGVDPATVDDTMLLVRNSWGTEWSRRFRGHFWMPISYAVNRSTGGDAWTGRRDLSLKAAAPPAPIVPEPSASQVAAAYAAARYAIDKAGYGYWVSDQNMRQVSEEIARAVVRAK